MSMDNEVYNFWGRVDDLRGEKTLGELAAGMGLKEQSLRAMRSQMRYPKADALSRLADSLGTTTEYLVHGKGDAVERDLPEVEFVRRSPEARTLIRAIMQDPALLSALSLVIESTRANIDREGKTS